MNYNDNYDMGKPTSGGLPNLENAVPALVNSVSYDMAKKYNILPLGVTDGKLRVAMTEPFNVFAMDDIRFVVKMDIVPVAADAADISSKIEAVYRQNSLGKNPGGGIVRNTGASPGNSQGTDVGAAPAVRLANSILAQSVELKASDIHLEPFADEVRARYRVDGSLTEIMTIPKEQYAAVSTRIKIIAGLDIAEKRLPQDGRIETEIDGGVYDFRVSTLPTVFGEKIEIRKLDRTGFSYDRKMLSFTTRENRLIDEAVGSSRGIVLVTGPTGSGKTTTIYSLLSELNRPDKNIVTIEDPVEYIVGGINQVHVNTKAGLTFASGLRSMLRQDPDIIMIGEIRDEETAEIAVRAAITGHLVLSTLHTNDAPGSVARLTDMGIPPYLISEAVSCVIAQRLVRTLCEHCKSGRDVTESELTILGMDTTHTGAGMGTGTGIGAATVRADTGIKVFDPVGCEKCNNIGYRGRSAIHELLFLDGDIKHHIEHRNSTEELRRMAVESGMTTLYDSCRNLVLEGRTSMREFSAAVGIRG